MAQEAPVRILISACLLGERVRYDGRAAARQSDLLERWRAEGRLVPVCPEVAGGLPVPRPRAEIVGAGQGAGVVAGTARVVTEHGDDVSDAFLAGARSALAAARRTGARMAILKAGSPSCGVFELADGTFSGTKIAGRGVCAALLAAHGIAVFDEHHLDDAARLLAALEGRS